MTRLKTEWIQNIEHDVKKWDASLKELTGAGLWELAMRGNGGNSEIEKERGRCRVGAISITSGQGVISTFAESVAAIVDALGFEVYVSKKTDVNGIYEARNWGADIVFVADDDRFLALNLKNSYLGENDRGTARGYVEALRGMMEKNGLGDIAGRKVLLLGYGRVGREIEAYLLNKGAEPVIYDRDKDIQKELEGKQSIDSADKIKEYDLIMDATSTGPWISKDMLHPEALIAAPGIPFSLDEEAKKHFQGRWIHDKLPIGIAGMLVSAMGGEDGK